MYDKDTFTRGTGVSLGVVAVVGLVFLSSGTAVSLPVAGIGGFTIQADRVEGDDLLLYPSLCDTSEVGDYPHATIELRNNSIDGLRLIKQSDIGDYTGDAVGGTARFVIETDEGVIAEELLLRTPALDAEEATFSGFELSETATNDLTRAFSIRAPPEPAADARQLTLTGGENPGFVLENTTIRARYLATNQISLPGLRLRVEYDEDGDGEFEFQFS